MMGQSPKAYLIRLVNCHHILDNANRDAPRRHQYLPARLQSDASWVGRELRAPVRKKLAEYSVQRRRSPHGETRNLIF